ncbi:DUF1707 domain-containing protein [Spirillospora sp. NPDC029432]|uniref:DUF1707 SHOCT-like domain-containing protein n=1 Tax=Spirillospora sp. NPDC029432 TaxID=3154599 RepID=UPI0034547373
MRPQPGTGLHAHQTTVHQSAHQAPGRPTTGQGGLRAADTDRDTTIERLGDALAEGALDTPEYERRLTLAAGATTLADLHELTADLPVSRAALAKQAAAREQDDRRAWRNEWAYWTGGAAIMTTIWAVDCLRDGRWDFYWPVTPLAIWAVILVSYALWPSDKD